MHVAEHTQQSCDSQHFQSCVRYWEEEADVKRIGGKDVDQPIEAEAVSYAPPESLVFWIQHVGVPDAERHLNGEDYGGEEVDEPQHPTELLFRAREGGGEHLQGADDDQPDDGVIDVVVPLFGVQIVVEDTVEFLFELVNFVGHYYCLLFAVLLFTNHCSLLTN